MPGVRVNGTLERRLPHNLHVSFDGVEGEALLMALGDLAVSTGSACAPAARPPSHVLQAIGATSERAGASIRFGLGRSTTRGRGRFRHRTRLDRGHSPAGSDLAPALRVLIVVSNREPYLHQTAEDGSIAAVPTTGGVSVALDALMRERGGTWIAHGAGDADRDAVRRTTIASASRRTLPPTISIASGSPTEEEHRYYGGFSNEGLWPLCHTVHVKPVFRAEDWSAYQSVNRRFAEAVAADLRREREHAGLHPGLPSRARRAASCGS